MTACQVIRPESQVIHYLKVGVKGLVKGFRKKISVLEIGKYKQVNRYTQGNIYFLPQSRPAVINAQPYGIVEQGRKYQQQEEQTAGFIIEEHTDDEKVGIA
jgi:hypothetical protein